MRTPLGRRGRYWRERALALADELAIWRARSNGQADLLQAVREAMTEMDCSADRDLIAVALGGERLTPQGGPFDAALNAALRPLEELAPRCPADVICEALHGGTLAHAGPCILAAIVVSELEDHGWVITPDADGSEVPARAEMVEVMCGAPYFWGREFANNLADALLARL